ncbi:MAG: FAD-dependent oxidoreductase [Prolixibacteraceae bacterium]|nr:FAD-dependent oxidoreductase [Prolixibacteraceae bacterium]
MKIRVLILTTFWFFTFLSCKNQGIFTQKPNQFDIVIYGGTSAGIAAAIQASRMGNSVVLIEPTNRIGGLTTGGLGQTDIGNKMVVGGISREFYQGIRKYYENQNNWKWQKRSEYRDGGQTQTGNSEDAMWTFEPSAALTVYNTMMAKENITLEYNQRLNRETGVKMQNQKIIEIEMEGGKKYRGKMFIDATYEGDLMAAAGITYTVGRESNKEFGETLNGVQANTIGTTLRGTVSINGSNHNFVKGVDPYIVTGDRSSGLLPFIVDGGRPGIDGRSNKGIQAYCFRMTLTDHPENRVPFRKPDNYIELEYELLFRNYEAGYDRIPWINSSMPNRKTDTNNRDGFSTDFIGQNYDYPEASYKEREKIIERHRSYQQGLMWSLAYHPRIPESIRNEVSRWGTCKDEYEREDGWQQQLYIREARRMLSDYIMTQLHCEAYEVAEDPVGMAAYGMDSHNVQRYVDANDYVQNEGNVEAHGFSPYPISYRAIIPKKGECSNLLVPVCVSSTHIAFGSIRMEPVFMVLGQSAATAASLAIQTESDIHSVDYILLKARLIKDKQILVYPPK